MKKQNNYTKLLFLFLLLFGGIRTAEAQVNLTNGLVAYYPFNGDFTDASGNNNNGNATGSAAMATDQWGNANSACVFGGTGNPGRVSIPSSPSLQFSSTATFAFWMKLNSNVGTSGTGNTVAGGDHCVFGKDGDAGGGLWHNVALSGTNINSRIGNVNMTTHTTNITPYSVGQWIHVTYVMDATETRVYVNGTLATTQAGAPYFVTMNGKPLVLGRYTSNWYPMNGTLDEFRVYNRVLNQQEITALSNTLSLTINVTAISPGTLCAGQPISASFNVASGTPLGGNIYTLELSDAAGSFTNPVALDTIISAATSGTFNLNLPQGVPSGTGYKLRVTSTAPAATGAASTSTFTVNGVLGDIPNAGTFRYCGNSGGRDYFVSTTTQTWTQAQTLCNTNGGFLAVIPDAATNTLLRPHVGAGSFIGFTDQVTEGTWRWINNDPVTYTNWFPGEPNNASNEDFGHMLAGGQWNDVNGTVTRLAYLQLSPATSNSPLCEGGTLTLFGATLSGATYAWSGPDGFTSAQQNPVIPNAGLAANGTYTLTYTKGGCTATATVNVTVNQAAANITQNSPLSPSLATGLILYYPLDGNANDASGNNLNGTVYGGVTAAADRFDNPTGAMKLNGTNGYIDAADAIYFTGGDFTVSTWIKTATNSSWARVFDFANGQSNNNVLLAYTNGTTGRPTAEVYTGTVSGGQVVSPTIQNPLNQWSHLVVIRSGGTGSIYVNGVLAAQGAMGAPQNVLRTLNYIGRSQWAGDTYANATFDEFRIYNRALSTGEIMQLLLQQPDPVGFVATNTAVCPSTATTLLLLNSQPGVSYQLQNAGNGANIGTAQTGNGDTLVFSSGTLTATTGFQIQATVSINGCVRILSPAITVTVTPTPAAPLTTGAQRCGPGTVTLTATGAPVGGYYQWYTTSTGGTPLPGVTTGSYTTPHLFTTTTYYVSAVGACESTRTPVTATILSVTGPAVDLHSNIIAYYKLDGNMADSSGYNNPLNHYWSSSYVNDRNANPSAAINVTGGAYLGCGNPGIIQQLNTQVTVAIWIKEVAGNWGFQTPLVNKWQGNGLYMGLDSYYDIGQQQQMNRVRWRVNSNTYVNSSVNVPHGVWHHIVCTFDGSRLKTYQNGVLTGDVAASGVITNTIVSLEIGRQANGLGNAIFDGSMDDVRIYNRVFNANEALALYNESSVAFANDPLCEGQTLLLTSPTIAGATYAWTGPNGFTSTQQNPPAIPNVTTVNSGTYTLIINNPNGCVTPLQTNLVVVNPLPLAPAGVNDTVCGSGNAVLTASGGTTYAWYANATGGSSLGSNATFTINNITATDTMWVSIVSSAGCEGPRYPVIAVYNNPVQTGLTVTGSTVCQGSNGTVQVQNAQTGVSYQAYYNNVAVSSTVSGTGTISIPVNTTAMNGGANSVSVVAIQSGCGNVTLTDTATIVINVPATPTITASGSLTICQGDAVTLTASPGAGYLWSTGAITAAITVTQAGTYTVAVIDANGCTAVSAPATVNVVAVPVAGITAAGATTICQGGSVTLNGSGGTSYLWSNGATTSSLSVTQSGTYYVIVSNGTCSDTSAAINVTVNPAPVAGITAGGPTTFCAGGSVNLVAGGSGSYLWSDGSTGASVTVTQSGTYYVIVSNGTCADTSAAVTVTVNTIPVAGITAAGATTFCQGGSVTLNGSGGTSYLWSDGSTGASVTVMQSGTYYVIVSNGSCTDTSAAITVTVNPLPAVSFTMPQNSYCFSDSPQQLTGGSPAGGTYSGQGVSGNMFTPALTTPGFVTLTYTYTDANGCPASANYTVWVDICSSVNNATNAGLVLEAFPNPAGPQVLLLWNVSAVSQLVICDVTGRVVDVFNAAQRQQLEIPLTTYATGIYYATLKTDAGTLHTRFIKE